MDNNYISQITETLKTINPERIILFGSHAQGNPTNDSDIDLLVVTSEEFYPKTFMERIDIQVNVSKLLSEFKNYVSIDLIVYTKPMFKKFLELDSVFSREIMTNGKVLYEEYN